MRPWPPKVIPSPILLWSVHKDGRVLTCEAALHPNGWEIRCDINGVVHYNNASRNYAAARQDAEAKLHELLALGWSLNMTGLSEPEVC